jgi:hypothetical protein
MYHASTTGAGTTSFCTTCVQVRLIAQQKI